MQEIANLPRERERWHVAKMLSVSPFDQSILSMTDPQLDWVREQFSLDHPVNMHLRQRFDDKVAQLMQSKV